MLEQHKMDISYTYQNTSIGIEICTENELQRLISALQSNDVVVLHNQHRDITIHIYVRCKEKSDGRQEKT